MDKNIMANLKKRILDTPKLNINFKGELRDFQKPIVNKYIQEKKWVDY